jgi:hypothetical protein
MQLGNLIVATPSNHSGSMLLTRTQTPCVSSVENSIHGGTGRADMGAATVAAIASMRAGA